jgi:UDPglucose 6-dehydrogenase
MSLESAELCKLASNYFLALKVSFANEISSLTEKMADANIDDVLNAVAADHRIHPSHLSAGLGFGGSCLPKDTRGLLTFSKSMSVEMPILSSTIRVNVETTERLIRALEKNIGDLRGKRIAVLGLSFKTNTDDTRNSPSLELIRVLQHKGAEIHAHDPIARTHNIPKSILKELRVMSEVEDTVKDADAVCVMTDWDVYQEMGLEKITSGMKRKLVIDGRRMFSSVPSGEDITKLQPGMYTKD